MSKFSSLICRPAKLTDFGSGATQMHFFGLRIFQMHYQKSLFFFLWTIDYHYVQNEFPLKPKMQFSLQIFMLTHGLNMINVFIQIFLNLYCQMLVAIFNTISHHFGFLFKEEKLSTAIVILGSQMLVFSMICF